MSLSIVFYKVCESYFYWRVWVQCPAPDSSMSHSIEYDRSFLEIDDTMSRVSNEQAATESFSGVMVEGFLDNIERVEKQGNEIVH
jgi:hypothetical protein